MSAPAAEAVETPEVNHNEQAKLGQATLRRLKAPVKGQIMVGQCCVLVSAALSIAPYIALVYLGNVLLAAYTAGVPVDAAQVWSVTGVLVGAFVAHLVCYMLALVVTHLADLKLRHLLRTGITQRLARAPLSWFSESNSGLVRKAIQDDTKTVHTAIAHSPVDLLNAIATPLALMGFVFWLDWRLGILSLATIPICLAINALSMRGLAAKTAEMDSKLGKVSATMTEFVAGITVVKAFGRVGMAHSAYLESADEFNRFFRDWSLPLAKFAILGMAWVSIPVLIVVNLGGGALLINAGFVTLPEVLLATLASMAVPTVIYNVSNINWAYQLAGAAALRLTAVLDAPVLPAATGQSKPTSSVVEFLDVCYSYGQTKAVDGVNLVLPEGTVTALVGPSGSGKSTLATLIARFADPDQGVIRIGGVDLKELPTKELYRTVAFVLQDPQLLRASVRENIALGRPDATLEEIRAAARVARIDDFVMSLPKGYDTIVGQDTALSGGQEQRISIARAVLLDTPVLLLDEATAFADPESEAEIQQALSDLVVGRTVLVIAHRPAAIRGADQIVVMEGGRIKAIGSHDQLLTEPRYQALLRQNATLEATK